MIAAVERELALCHSADVPVFFPQIASTLGTAHDLDRRTVEAMPLLDHGSWSAS